MSAKRPTAHKPARPAAGKPAESPASRAKVLQVGAAAAKERATRLKSHGSGFMNFIREQGVVGLAVGLAIGAAAGDTVKKLVQAFIDPIVQLIIGSQEALQTASHTVEIGSRKGEFMYGAFLSSLITLIATALVIYLIIHLMKLDKLDKKKG